MSSKKNILIIIPSLVGGGAEKALITLLRHLNNNKYKIDLCVAEKKGIYLDQVPDYVSVYYLFTNRFARKIVIELHMRFNISWPFKWLTQRTIQSDYDTGICFLDSVFSDMLLFLSHRVSKTAVVLHSSYKSNINRSKFIKGAYKERLQSRYRKIDTIVGVSQDVIEEFTAVLGEYNDLRVINNPINRDEIINKSHVFNPDFSENALNIIAVGSLLPVKGYSNLIKACKLLKDSGREFKLRILGKGPLEEQLRNQIHRLGLKDYVYLLGYKSNPYPYMRESDIFVMSSLAEGLPTVLCEAMILGKPIVTTNCPGCRGLVDKGTYGLMTDITSESLFEGLRSMIDDSKMRYEYGQKAKQRSRSFNVDKVIAEYEKILDPANEGRDLKKRVKNLVRKSC